MTQMCHESGTPRASRAKGNGSVSRPLCRSNREIAVNDYKNEQKESVGFPSHQPHIREYQPWVTQLPVRLVGRCIAQGDDLLVWMHHTFVPKVVWEICTISVPRLIKFNYSIKKTTTFQNNEV